MRCIAELSRGMAAHDKPFERCSRVATDKQDGLCWVHIQVKKTGIRKLRYATNREESSK